MRFRKGESKRKTPKIGKLDHVWVEWRLPPMICDLQLVYPHELARYKEIVNLEIGRPRYAAFENDVLEIYPAPDRTVRIVLQYYPPLRIA